MIKQLENKEYSLANYRGEIRIYCAGSATSLDLDAGFHNTVHSVEIKIENGTIMEDISYKNYRYSDDEGHDIFVEMLREQ